MSRRELTRFRSDALQRSGLLGLTFVVLFWTSQTFATTEAPDPNRLQPGTSSSAKSNSPAQSAAHHERDAPSSPTPSETRQVEEPEPEIIEVEVETSPDRPTHYERASSRVTRQELEERQARSAPDALRFEPGVYVQQSAHAQASPYIRALTGQQTVVLFDGIRLNNSSYRQGPNQYFFTVDTQSVQSIEVIRGSASTLYGSDALGGAILSHPLKANAPKSAKGFWIAPQLMLRTRSADSEWGGRVQSAVGYKEQWNLIGGIGYRDVGQLETAGAVRSPATQKPHKSPHFEPDGRTQVGTGFRELAGDARLTWRPHRSLEVLAAYYSYRQYDAPRTDKCPPDEGRTDECLVYLEQFRDLAYVGLNGHHMRGFIRETQVRLSMSRQHEWRQWDIDNLIPDIDGGTQHDGIDDVWTWGGQARAKTREYWLGGPLTSHLEFGADGYFDQISSLARQRFTDVEPNVEIQHSRGQYVDGARYFSGGFFAQVQTAIGPRLLTEVGGRIGLAIARSPEDQDSDTQRVQSEYMPIAGHFGFHWLIHPALRWQTNVDRGFRAPNLDDLTSRQQIGPGYQYENSRLIPESTWSFENGLRLVTERIEASVFGFHTRLQNAMARAPREVQDCPDSQSGPQGCNASRTRFQLINLDDTATITGAEFAAKVAFRPNLSLATTMSYAYGVGPNPQPRATDSASYREQLPLSRVPPLNGSLELRYSVQRWLPPGFWVGSALRYAAAQTRLALADEADVRIPQGGTPAFAVWDLRAGYRFRENVDFGLSLENVLDTPYRYHGSSVNGAGRSISATLRIRP